MKELHTHLLQWDSWTRNVNRGKKGIPDLSTHKWHWIWKARKAKMRSSISRIQWRCGQNRRTLTPLGLRCNWTGSINGAKRINLAMSSEMSFGGVM